jgi:hypothetical protein
VSAGADRQGDGIPIVCAWGTTAVVPLPYTIQRRAWEAALMLRQDYADRLEPAERFAVEMLTKCAPEDLAWEQAGGLLALWRQHVERV